VNKFIQRNKSMYSDRRARCSQLQPQGPLWWCMRGMHLQMRGVANLWLGVPMFCVLVGSGGPSASWRGSGRSRYASQWIELWVVKIGRCKPHHFPSGRMNGSDRPHHHLDKPSNWWCWPIISWAWELRSFSSVTAKTFIRNMYFGGLQRILHVIP